MAFTDKLKFWKKGDDLAPLEPPAGEFGEPDFGGLDKPPSDPFEPGRDSTPGLGGTGELESQPGLNKPPGTAMDKGHDVSMTGPSYEGPPESGDLKHAPLSPMEHRAPSPAAPAAAPSRDIEVMSAKIDAIKANVESINQRLESIERMLMTQEKTRKYQW